MTEPGSGRFRSRENGFIHPLRRLRSESCRRLHGLPALHLMQDDLRELPPAPWDVALRVQRNSFRGEEQWQLLVEAVREAE